ncbi:FAD binding domain-containing protein [Maledivibacter halophilus]|uniref:Carbon-monoxide dehydrogenase medium subunit n=1 Tax=Maledivibacter halophilus TaxID=36842 RepID=A0A1T5ITU8_9FIRM|nr:xanthine dehydrogenase family protein subunit M [Maledivibacter halophilus]SKC42408.1 carbon-monoxide dehydrogenase medium subunit [Maledivibacter halophilus]
MKKFDYFKPNSLKEASQMLIQNEENTHILNGGTDLIVRINEEIICPDVVVDIKGIKELYEIKYDEVKGLTIGACVTMNDLDWNEIVREKFKIVSDSAHMVGSSQIRNRATMIGNICNASPLADTATCLYALDAVVLIYGPNGEREVSIHDFILSVRKTCLKPGEIVTAIRIPEYKEKVFAPYQKLSRRKEVDLSTVCASVIKVDGEIRIALGSVAPTPVRARKTEDFLKGKDLSDEVIYKAGAIASTEVSPIDDVRGSKEYRLEMVDILVRRGLRELKGDK